MNKFISTAITLLSAAVSCADTIETRYHFSLDGPDSRVHLSHPGWETEPGQVYASNGNEVSIWGDLEHREGTGALYCNGGWDKNILSITFEVQNPVEISVSMLSASWLHSDPHPADLHWTVYGQTEGHMWSQRLSGHSSPFTNSWGYTSHHTEITEGTTLLTLTLFNDTTEVFGNDFALDNIWVTIREEAAPGPEPVPEPGTLLLGGIGMMGVAAWKKRRKFMAP